MSSFNFKSFVNEQHKKFELFLTLEEVHALLNVGNEAYSRDNSSSTGKTLLLNSIRFKGVKDNGDVIDYHKKLKKGLSIWITVNSNLKGKSSIFKIIKFALTGENSVKDDVKRWVKEILLCFTIGTNEYAIHILDHNKFNATLYSQKIEEWEKLKDSNKRLFFRSTTKKDFREQMQKFFFDQFSYYSLKWTQASGKKDNLNLSESSASWKTYFKSIYLESKDYGVLFFGGNTMKHQGQKIFQTLMGLDFTFAINQLTIKKDKLQNQKAQEKIKINNKTNNVRKKIDELNKKIGHLTLQINELDKKNTNNNEIKILNKKHKTLNIEYRKYLKLKQDYSELLKKEATKRSDLEEKRNTYKSIKNKIKSTDKKITELTEYLEIGVFLSDLEIKNCPSSHHSIDDDQKKIALRKHKCPLCNDDIDESEAIDVEVHKSKLEELKQDSKKAKHEQETVKEKGKKASEELKNISENLKSKKDAINAINDENLVSEIKKIGDKIHQLISKDPSTNSKREQLIVERAVIKYQLSEIQKDLDQIGLIEKYNKKCSLLESSISYLIQKRYELGNNAIARLQELMLEEIQFLGLKSITSISITEKFDVRYTQGGEEINFEKISEGEQLRAKLAFYLSLIQLDIEYNMGKHTRLLMIDSPGKEEAGNAYKNGLINSLTSIESRYRDNLQILIATADSRFENVLENQFVYPEETYIF